MSPRKNRNAGKRGWRSGAHGYIGTANSRGKRALSKIHRGLFVMTIKGGESVMTCEEKVCTSMKQKGTWTPRVCDVIKCKVKETCQIRKGEKDGRAE